MKFPERKPNVSADEALQRLMDGNLRFRTSQCIHSNHDEEYRQSLIDQQNPFAVILTCSDSRVSPEIIFDVGIGDLFIIRVAGNIVDKSVKASIEYACVHLGVNLVLVMGHQNCGAVTAAVSGGKTNMHIDDLIAMIRPSTAPVRRYISPSDPSYLSECVKANTINSADSLECCDVVMKHLVSHGVNVVPSHYLLGTGQVELLSDKSTR